MWITIGERTTRPGLAAILLAALPAFACVGAEPPEAAQARLQKTIFEKQIAGLEQLLADAEKGGVYTRDQLAVGIDEGVVRELVNATLPLKVKIGQELEVEVQKAEAYFRFTQAGVLLQSRASSTRFPDTFVQVQLLGALSDVKLADGRFSARIRLASAQLQGISLGTMARDVLDSLLRQHLGTIEAAIPPFEVPVRIEQTIRIGGLGEGPVTVAPGSLPLEMSVARVLPGNQRLWVLLDVRVGRWQREASPAVPPESGAAVPASTAPGGGSAARTAAPPGTPQQPSRGFGP
jgi:hypothetical protein